MKSRFLTLILAGILSLMSSVAGLWAGTVEPLNITDYPSLTHNSFPMISGTKLVWQAKGGLSGASSQDSDWEIFSYDMVSKEITQLTDDENNDTSPQTDGANIVWQKNVPGQGNQIFLHQNQDGSSTGGTLISSSANTDNYAPKIASSKIIWEAQTVTSFFEPSQIMYYDIENSNGPVIISDPAVDSNNPRIDNEQAIWTQELSNGTRTVYLSNLKSNAPVGQPAPDNFALNNGSPAAGEQKVLTRHDGNDREIFLYNHTDDYVQITNNDQNDTNPIIGQNHVAWMSGSDIYVADISPVISVLAKKANEADTTKTGFKATWKAPADGVNNYILDVSTDPDFTDFNSVKVGNSTEYKVDGLSADKTYYYRVSAVINGSQTAFSKSIPVSLVGSSDSNSTPAPQDNNRKTTANSNSDAVGTPPVETIPDTVGQDVQNPELESVAEVATATDDTDTSWLKKVTTEIFENLSFDGLKSLKSIFTSTFKMDSVADKANIHPEAIAKADSTGSTSTDIPTPSGGSKSTGTDPAVLDETIAAVENKGKENKLESDAAPEAEEQAPAKFALEIGELDVNSSWVSVAFSKQFQNPVVVLGTPTLNDNEPFSVRMRNLDSSGFEIRLQEWEYLDGTHAMESISYMVMEKGHFTLSNGATVEAGTFVGSSKFKQVRFSSSFQTKPVVISSVLSTNGTKALIGQVNDLSKQQFTYRFRGQEANSRKHPAELVSYIAWQKGAGAIGNLLYEASNKGVVKDRLSSMDFKHNKNGLPFLFIGSKKTKNNDVATIRYQVQKGNKIKVYAQEETSLDKETKRKPEPIGYIALFISNK